MFVVGLAGCSTGERSLEESSASTTSLRPEPRPTTSEPQVVYTVQAGDNLSQIAGRFNTTIEAVMQANDLSTDVIRPGQELRIPGAPQTQTTRGGDQEESPTTTPTTVPAPTSGASHGRGTPLLFGGLLVGGGLFAGVGVLFVGLRRRRRRGNGLPRGTSIPVPGSRPVVNPPAPPASAFQAQAAAPESPRPKSPLASVSEAVGPAAEASRFVTPPATIQAEPPVVRPPSSPEESGHGRIQARVIGLAPMRYQSRDGDFAGLMPPEEPLAVRPCPQCGTVQSVGEIGCPCVCCGEHLPAGSTYPWPVVLVPKG